MIDWTKSMEQLFEYYEVDPNTWQDIGLIKTVKTCSIDRDSTAETLGSATIDVTDLLGESYIRVYLIAIQNGFREKIALGTFLVQSPSSKFDGKIRDVSLDCYTPLIELKENPPPLGYSLLKDDNIMNEAYRIAVNNCRAPIVQSSSEELLKDNFVSNTNDNWLTFLRDLIALDNREFYLDEFGKIYFAPKQTNEELQPVWTYDYGNSSILSPEISLNHDLYGIPNVVEIVCITPDGAKEFTLKNDDPNSPTSIQARGREIKYRDTNPSLPKYPSSLQLKEYATQLLKNLSSIEYTISYTHGYCSVRIGDCVRLNYDKAGLVDIKAKVISQSISCTSGCQVNETAVFSKKLWI